MPEVLEGNSTLQTPVSGQNLPQQKTTTTQNKRKQAVVGNVTRKTITVLVVDIGRDSENRISKID